MNLVYMTIPRYSWVVVPVASGISMKILGLKKVLDNLKDAGPRGTKAMGVGLYLEGNNIMADSKREAPHDIGTLETSGYVTLPHISGKTVTVEIGYGGSAEAYAEIQHERTDLKHQGGKKAKYLQDPMNKAKSGFTKNVNHFAAQAFQANKGASKVSGMPDKPE